MYSANVDSLSPRVRKCGKTSSRTTLSICSAGRFLKCDQRRCCSFLAELARDGTCPVRAARFSARVSAMSSSRANIRNEICSMTVSGLVIPPVQNSVQSLSIWLRSGPVIMRRRSLGSAAGTIR